MHIKVIGRRGFVENAHSWFLLRLTEFEFLGVGPWVDTISLRSSFGGLLMAHKGWGPHY